MLVSLHGDDPPWSRPQWSLWCWHEPGSLSWIHKMKLEVGRYWIRCNLLVTNVEWRSSVLPTGSQLVQEPVFSVWTKPSIELDLGQDITNLHHADCCGSVQSFQIKRCVKRFREGFFLFKMFSIFASSFWNRWISRLDNCRYNRYSHVLVLQIRSFHKPIVLSSRMVAGAIEIYVIFS